MKNWSNQYAPEVSRPLAWFYRYLHWVVYHSTQHYFEEVTVLHPEYLQYEGPAIIVANHPNTLMDPMVIGGRVPKLLFFLANAGLWRSRIGAWFFGTFYCIPVARRKDRDVKGINNDDSFAAAVRHLERGGSIYVAPEGTSELERRIRPVKTGTARLVLQALRENEYDFPLSIIPVGLTYSAPTRFRSKVWMHVGPPIRPRVTQADAEAGPDGIIRELTQVIQQQLEDLTLVTADEAQDRLLEKLETVLRHAQPLRPADEWYRSRDLLKSLQALPDTRYREMAEVADQYTTALQSAGLTDRIFSRAYRPSVLGLPIFLFGWVNNILPAALTELTAQRIVADPTYRSSARWFGALVIFPILYTLQAVAVQWVFGRWWITLLYLLLLIPTGLFAHRYGRRLGVLWERSRYRRLDADRKAALQNLREKLLSQISPFLPQADDE